MFGYLCVILHSGRKVAGIHTFEWDLFAGFLQKNKILLFWLPRSTWAMQAAALGSSIGTAVVGGIFTGQYKSKHFLVPHALSII